MVVEGVLVNGRIELTAPPEWPEGALVTVALSDANSETEDYDDLDPPPAEETYEEYLESLRRIGADIKAGKRGIPLEEAFRQIAAKHNLPPVTPE